jgi:DNA-directed RNA polymerase subunit alpha
MSLQTNIILPSKPRAVKEEGNLGVYEIDGFYPGYGHTIGNSLRRIVLSSIPGAAITSVAIEGATHEFSTIEGIKEDVITILLNLKRVRFRVVGDEPQRVTIKVKGAKRVSAADIVAPAQVEVLTKDQHIAEITKKDAEFTVSLTVVKGLGYVAKEEHQKDKVEIGAIAVDASFTPIRRASYEVENMRVGDRTDHDRLKFTIETDGTLTPREALETSISTMIEQLQAIVGFAQKVESKPADVIVDKVQTEAELALEAEDHAKVKVEDLDLSTRTVNALIAAGIKSLAGVARKSEADLLALEGLGEKGIQEIKRAAGEYGITLK